jgi:hypothetical protein
MRRGRAGARRTGRKRKRPEVSNLQLYIAIGLPTLAVVASLVVSLFQISGIREDIREIRADMKLLTGKVYEMMAQGRG